MLFSAWEGGGDYSEVNRHFPGEEAIRREAGGMGRGSRGRDKKIVSLFARQAMLRFAIRARNMVVVA